MHRAVSQMKRRLATLGHEQRGRRKGAAVDVRRTMRASLETGGVPLRLRYRPKRPRRPEIYVLCDVSTSVTSASVFFLSVLHALHDSFRKLRSFVFIERISEVTDVFEHERDFAVVAQRISSEGGVADVSGYTDYGRVWLEFLTEISDELDPRSTVIVLGDARTNGREPHAEVFAQVSERAGRLFWLNPEPKLYWNYGDSVMAAYERYCDGAFECWTTRHLENFVNVVAGGVPRPTEEEYRREAGNHLHKPAKGGKPMPPSYPVTLLGRLPGAHSSTALTTFFRIFAVIPISDPARPCCRARQLSGDAQATGVALSGAISSAASSSCRSSSCFSFRKKYPPAGGTTGTSNLHALRQPDRRLTCALMDDRIPARLDEHQAVHLDFAYPDGRELANAACRWSSG